MTVDDCFTTVDDCLRLWVIVGDCG
jgi:hypothetical protein